MFSIYYPTVSLKTDDNDSTVALLKLLFEFCLSYFIQIVILNLRLSLFFYFSIDNRFDNIRVVCLIHDYKSNF